MYCIQGSIYHSRWYVTKHIIVFMTSSNDTKLAKVKHAIKGHCNKIALYGFLSCICQPLALKGYIECEVMWGGEGSL